MESEITGFALCLFILLSSVSGIVRSRLSGLIDETLQGLIIILVQMLALIIPYCIIRRTVQTAPDGGRLNADETAAAVPVFLAVFFLYFIANLVSSSLFRSAGIEVTEATWLPSGKTALVLFFISYTVLSAVLEELFFRRALLNVLRPYGKWTSISISSLFFALSHWEAVRVIPVFVFSFFLGLTYTETNKLRFPVVIHTLNNLLAFFNIWITEHGNAEKGASVMIAAALTGFICLVVLVVVLPLGRISSSELPEERADASVFFTWPVKAALVAYAVILISSFGVF